MNTGTQKTTSTKQNKDAINLDITGTRPWEEQESVMRDRLEGLTIPIIQAVMKSLNYTGKMDKVRKADLIAELLKLKQQEWLSLVPKKPAKVEEIRPSTKKRKIWEREEIEEDDD